MGARVGGGLHVGACLETSEVAGPNPPHFFHLSALGLILRTRGTLASRGKPHLGAALLADLDFNSIHMVPVGPGAHN